MHKLQVDRYNTGHQNLTYMTIREAHLTDIPKMWIVRYSVKENMLTDADEVTDEDCVEYLTQRGKGWVCEMNSEIIGFAIIDLKDNNVWALFLKPEYENKGIGKKLHDIMIDWYFSQTKDHVWLGTLPGTRAEGFYRNAGWKEIGIHGDGEIKFEMTYQGWQNMKKK